MLDALRFVQRGVARRDFVPGLTHFRIEDRRCTGYNGAFSLSAPVDIGFNIAPHAALFTQALNACEDVITLKMEPDGSLLVRSGSFRITVPCVPIENVPPTFPEGVMVPMHESLLDAFNALREFVGTDASRPWATGILFRGQSAYATNNAVVVEYWLGTPFPFTLNVPAAVIDEVIKVNEELVGLQLAGGSITFHYADGRWIKSALLALDWPDITHVLDSAWEGAGLVPVPAGLAEACEKLAPFGDKREAKLYLRGTDVATHADGAVSGGALVEVSGIPDKGVYHTLFLNQVLAVAETINLNRYPLPIPFTGDHLRGAMLGVRV